TPPQTLGAAAGLVRKSRQWISNISCEVERTVGHWRSPDPTSCRSGYGLLHNNARRASLVAVWRSPLPPLRSLAKFCLVCHQRNRPPPDSGKWYLAVRQTGAMGQDPLLAL